MMIKNLLLSTLISLGVGTSVFSATSIDKDNAGRPITPPGSADFLLLDTLFPTNTITFSGEYLEFNGSLSFVQLQQLPSYFNFDFIFIGDYIYNDLPFVVMEFEMNYNGSLRPVYSISNETIPFIHSSFVTNSPLFGDYSVTMNRYYLTDTINAYGTAQVRVLLEFPNEIPTRSYNSYASYFRSNVGYGNSIALKEWVDQIKDIAYNDGVVFGSEVASGTWLGQLVFGTIGGMVGFLFSISDFEVLGVSIMSIITLFVAISILILLMKVLK